MWTGLGWSAQAARTASVRNANRLRPCWAHVACTLSIRSTLLTNSAAIQPVGWSAMLGGLG